MRQVRNSNRATESVKPISFVLACSPRRNLCIGSKPLAREHIQQQVRTLRLWVDRRTREVPVTRLILAGMSVKTVKQVAQHTA